MKRKSLLLVLISLFVISCQNKTEENKNQTTDLLANAQTVTELLNSAEQNIDSLVKVKGTVTHTCKHSGRRCFIADSTETSIRVEATEKIGGFNQELVGSEIVVEGFLREKRLEKAYIDKWEAKTLKEKATAEETEADHCDTELNSIKKMRAWMKQHNKDYYSTYYIDGNDFAEVE